MPEQNIALLQKAHDQLHRLVTTFVPGNDGAYSETTALMAELRALAAAPAPAAREVQRPSKAWDTIYTAMRQIGIDNSGDRVQEAINRAREAFFGAVNRALASTPSPSAAEPVVLTGEMVRAALAIEWPGLYGKELFTEHDGPTMRETTEKRIELFRKQFAAALNAQPSPAASAAEPVGFELTHSIIHECPAIKLPQHWVEKLGNAARIIVLKGASEADAEMIVARLNAHPPAERAAAREGMTEEQALQLATEKFPHWQIDIQERFVIELIRAAEAFHGIAAPAGGEA